MAERNVNPDDEQIADTDEEQVTGLEGDDDEFEDDEEAEDEDDVEEA